MYHFFSFMAKMKHIKRWGLMRNTREENIQEHSLQTAMIADSGASEVVTRKAALRILSIHAADPAVQMAIDNWGTDDENKSSKGFANLGEAAAVAALYELSLGGGTPLPAEFKKFLKYKPKPEAI